jgi:peptide-methionine (S)-S-oxide reductase
VVRTRVGYTGGTLEHPTYRHMGDHTESMQIDFDPSRIPYAEMLRIFLDDHDPSEEPYMRQYMSGIWPANRAQHQQAREALGARAEKLRRRLFTEVAPLGVFTNAEDYHQKYYLRHEPALVGVFGSYDPAGFRESRVAARLNGVVGRYATPELIESELPSWGLGTDAQMLVKRLGGVQQQHLP